MKSTAVLHERGPDVGTVRIVCPGYPPDADTQARASDEMASVCRPRTWKVVDIRLQDVSATGDYCPYSVACPRPNQQVDLRFACVGN